MNGHVRASGGLVASPVAKSLVSFEFLKIAAGSLDAGCIAVSSILGTSLYQSYLNGQLFLVDASLGTGVVAAAYFFILSIYQKLYRIDVILNPSRYIKEISLSLAFALLSLASIMFLLKIRAEYSRGEFILFGLFAFSSVTISRLALAQLSSVGIKRRYVTGRRAVVIGEASELEGFPPQHMCRFGIEEIARIRIDHSEPNRGLAESARAQVNGAIGLARDLRASEFVLMIPWGRTRLLSEVSELLRSSPLAVRLLPDSIVRGILTAQSRRALDIPFDFELQREPLSRPERLAKRFMDITLSLVALVLLAPILLMTAAAIKLDSRGPLLFRQRRVGFDNREFVIFKFRSMTVLEDGAEIVQASRADLRVTRIGTLLRRTSIDELPQLFNVIRGEMSLVGPRPHARAHHDKYCAVIAKYALRHHVKPGLTGMAQVLGLRGETPQLVQMERRVEQDIWYINHWSLHLDLLIIARTCLALLRHEAY